MESIKELLILLSLCMQGCIVMFSLLLRLDLSAPSFQALRVVGAANYY
jgi:hypothetical protein